MCIVKRHTYIRGADKQPNTNKVFFWIARSVDCRDCSYKPNNNNNKEWERERELELENFILQGL